MHHPTDRITHTTAFVTPVVEHWLEREIYTANKPRILIVSFLVKTFNNIAVFLLILIV